MREKVQGSRAQRVKGHAQRKKGKREKGKKGKREKGKKGKREKGKKGKRGKGNKGKREKGKKGKREKGKKGKREKVKSGQVKSGEVRLSKQVFTRPCTESLLEFWKRTRSHHKIHQPLRVSGRARTRAKRSNCTRVGRLDCTPEVETLSTTKRKFFHDTSCDCVVHDRRSDADLIGAPLLTTFHPCLSAVPRLPCTLVVALPAMTGA